LSLSLREERRLRVFENRVLRKIFGPKREEDESCRKLHNDELHSLHFASNTIRVIKSRRMRWAGHVACIEEGRGQREDLGVGGRTTLRWTLGRQGSMWRTGFSWLRIGSGGGLSYPRVLYSMQAIL
jgi:hypothetical protein